MKFNETIKQETEIQKEQGEKKICQKLRCDCPLKKKKSIEVKKKNFPEQRGKVGNIKRKYNYRNTKDHKRLL